MGGISGQAVTAFQGLFSRAFWLGYFLPVAIFASLNILMARLSLLKPLSSIKILSRANGRWRALGRQA